MNVCTLAEQSALTLVDIVELKWMLAGEGLHVHVEKLQSDPCYARECLLAAHPGLAKVQAKKAQAERRDDQLAAPDRRLAGQQGAGGVLDAAAHRAPPVAALAAADALATGISAL